MKTILCFGDSNTWGYDPEASAKSPSFPIRHPPEVRWTGVLARELGPEWHVIEEGQNGRTTVHDDPFFPCRNGRDILPALLESHQPLDLVVLMLGTNDLKAVFGIPAGEVAAGVTVVARLILQSTAGLAGRAPCLLLVAPPAVSDQSIRQDLEEKFSGAEAKSRRFPELYRSVAATLGCGFLDAQEFTTPSPFDGLHLNAASHAALGVAMAAACRSIASDLRQ